VKADFLSSVEAERVLEDLRKGIPPKGFLEYFTVGRKDQIQGLNDHLNGDEGHALLLKANYGSGKSHLLELIEEKARATGSATSFVVLDANSGVRFNRMDQIFGAILRNLRIEHEGGHSDGLADVLDFLVESAEAAKANPKAPGHQFWSKVTSNWKWDYSEAFESPPLYVAFRAWAASDSSAVRDLVIDWLSFPENYRSGRRRLYEALIQDLRGKFRDPRSDRQFLSPLEGVFDFRGSGYKNCWGALEDLNRMCLAAGVPGMVILFDEFEDVLTNLKNINWKESAFWNLFRFVSGDRFTGKTFYAVTPSFAKKCKDLLIEKDRWDFDYSQFDHLPTFEMSPLGKRNLIELAGRIVPVHETAYDYEVDDDVKEEMKDVVAGAAKSAVQDRARQAIKAAVSILDDQIM
jgi:hypothetical protein